MRIVAGSLKGRTISAPDGTDTRPTTDRVREALFSSLYSLRGGFEDATVLDAFAGSGALGIEALSRGAARAVFFERDKMACSYLRRNLESFGLGAPDVQVCQRDVLQNPPTRQAPPFDMAFLDPPYADDGAAVFAMMRELADAGALAEGCIVVYEHAIKAQSLAVQVVEGAGFVLESTKKYGKTGIVLCRWEAARG